MTRGPDALRGVSLRIAAQTAALMVAVLAIAGSAFVFLYDHSLDASNRNLLVGAASRIDRPEEAPPGVFVTVSGSQGTASSTDLPRSLPDQGALDRVRAGGPPETDTIVEGPASYLVHTRTVGDRVVQTALNLQDSDDERRRAVVSVLIAGAIAVLLVGVVAGWLASRSVRPMADALARQRRFVADASHELRTPLTHLSLRVQMLSRRASARPLVAADLEPVADDAQVLAEILDELLAVSDQRAADFTSVDLIEVVRSVVAAAGSYAEEHGVTLVWDAATQHEVIDGSQMSLRRAVTALVDNAIDHARSRVEVNVTAERRAIRIAVTDDGPGIDPMTAPRLFERFSGEARVDGTGRRHFGLGLALVAEVATAHGGRVTVDRVGAEGGTVFTLVLARSKPS